jgi:HdeA/HdeB family
MKSERLQESDELLAKREELLNRKRRDGMRRTIFSITMSLGILFATANANAQVNLSEYADPEGFLDIQSLTCAQLAGTWQDQADLLSSWYSGWYNGLAKRHYMDIRKGREAEHELIVYCKANPQLRIIQAIDIVFKGMREKLGIKVQ